jgi:hypothetical protein
MALLHERLAQGQLPTTTSAIYTTPVGKTAYLKSIYFHNTGASEQTIKIYINGSGNANRIFEGIVASKATFEWDIIYSFILSTGQTLQAETTTANTVNYFLHGATE